MNCRNFERHVVDWLSGRLPPERSGPMAAHMQICAACARLARAEAQLRESWRVMWATPPVPNIWPRLALRLDAPGHRKWQGIGGNRRLRWTLGGATVMAAVTICGLCLGPLETMWLRHHDAPGMTLPPVSRDAGKSSSASVIVSALNDVSQVDPVVDDPTGTSMEDIWAHIQTSGSGKTGGK